MDTRARKLKMRRIDDYFEKTSNVLRHPRPSSGWIKEVRESLGMSMAGLAARMGVIKQRVDKIERDEVADKVTLETMKRAAEALECEFVYFLVPKKSLAAILEDRAYAAAKHIAKDVQATMSLENQAVSKKSLDEIWKSLAQEMLATWDKRLWKNP